MAYLIFLDVPFFISKKQTKHSLFLVYYQKHIAIITLQQNK